MKIIIKKIQIEEEAEGEEVGKITININKKDKK
jgi:hypothetical protein